ncbi:MAG TPA: hypothetical protein DDY45_13660 [Verrucomicrobiales bacterium]|nr:hypothetical protein [Verrucomicrobiales bacterium]
MEVNDQQFRSQSAVFTGLPPSLTSLFGEICLFKTFPGLERAFSQVDLRTVRSPLMKLIWNTLKLFIRAN